LVVNLLTCDSCTTLHNVAQCCASPEKISVRILMERTKSGSVEVATLV
jgi:hypothetical protein